MYVKHIYALPCTGNSLISLGGNQQFTTVDFTFSNTRTAIDMLWDWGWTWKYMLISGAETAINVGGDYRGGSILLLDSFIMDTTTGIDVTTPKGSTTSQIFSVTLDNLQVIRVGTTVKHESAGVTPAGTTGSETIASWITGKMYDHGHPDGFYKRGALVNVHPMTESLSRGNGYFTRRKLTYSDIDSNTFLSARAATEGKQPLHPRRQYVLACNFCD